MKQINLFSIVALIAILFSSCGSSVTEFTVKNESTDFDGDLYGYLEVVDGSYKASMVGSDLKLNVKLKAVQPLGENVEFDEIRAELLDESGMPLSGVGTFYISKGLWAASSDNDKVDNALKKEVANLLFNLFIHLGVLVAIKKH